MQSVLAEWVEDIGYALGREIESLQTIGHPSTLMETVMSVGSRLSDDEDMFGFENIWH